MRRLRRPGGRLRVALDRLAARADMDALKAGLEQDFFEFWDFQFTRLVSQLQPREIAIDDLPDRIRSRYVALDGRVRVEIVPQEDIQDLDARKRFVNAVERVVDQPSGSARTVLKAGEVVSQSMLQAAISAIFIVSLLLLVVLRDPIVTIIILFPLLLAGVLTAAAGVLIDMPFNYANVIVLPLLIGLGVDSGIHLALRRIRPGDDQSSVLDTTTPRAVFFSAVTTIASFGSLSLSAHRGTSSMGALLTIAVAFTLLCTLVIVPVAMQMLDASRARRNGARS